MCFYFNDSIVKELQTTTEDTLISDLLPVAATAKYPIAVIGEGNQLKGIVSKAAVLSSPI